MDFYSRASALGAVADVVLKHRVETIPPVLPGNDENQETKQNPGRFAELTFPDCPLAQVKEVPKSLVQASGRMETGEEAPVSAFSASCL